MSNEQKLREALQAISHIDDTTNHSVDASAALDRIGQIARQALALPTAAPVGAREAFGYFYIVNGVHEGFCKGVEPPPDDSYDEGTLVPVYRSALSAGDAVDAQRYRWLMDNCTLGIKQNGVGWILNTSACVAPDCIKDVGAAIDAAMRKGQL